MDVFFLNMATSLNAGTVLAIAALGLLLNEKAGIVNLGAEGMMLCAALAGFAAVVHTGSGLAGLAAGMLAGAVLAGIFADRKFNRMSGNIAPPGGHHATEPGRFELSLRARSPRLSDISPFSALPGAALPRSVGTTAVANPYQLTR